MDNLLADTRHVLLSDSAMNNAIVGILSVTDFIRVLLLLHKLVFLLMFEILLNPINPFKVSGQISVKVKIKNILF